MRCTSQASMVLAAVVAMALRFFHVENLRQPKQSSDAAISWLPNPTGRCRAPRLDWNSSTREERFPSVEDRVCLYMTRWYDPYYGTAKQWKPVLRYRHDDASTLEIYLNNVLIYIIERIDNDLANDIPFFLFRNNMSLIETIAGQKHWILVLTYGRDTSKVCNKFNHSNPLLFAWGDQELKIDVHLPIFGKWRFNNVDHHDAPAPILAPLDTFRHFGQFNVVHENDIPWEQKINKAVWRGTMTGIVENGRFPYDYDLEANALDTCLKFERCRLVYRNHNHTDTDVGFSHCSHEELKIVNGVDMMQPYLSIKDQLQYKMLISIEGNDVATGLKWNLLSRSVVLMPPPTKTIFSLEVLLEPWVHYIPLNIDNVSEAIQWVLQNEDEAQRISKRATNLIEDLFLHPKADQDREDVLQEVANRVTALWQ
ncbi:Glycosyl transferase family 90 [Fragilaria crotonensis]|nr:Glycosyl transferase family 90 [Fragilaria crotonensis]